MEASRGDRLARIAYLPSAVLPGADEIALGRGLRIGDPRALRETWRRFYPMVGRIALCGTGSREAAEAIARRVLGDLLTRAETGGAPAGLTTLALSITAQQMRRAAAPRRPRRWFPTKRRPDPFASPAVARLFELLDRLTAVDRIAFTLRFFEALEPAEVAAALDAPVVTVERRLSRSWTRISKAVGKDRVLAAALPDLPQVEEGLRRLVDLTRRSLDDVSFPADESGLIRLRQERDPRVPRRRVRWSTLIGVVVVLGALGGLATWPFVGPGAPLTFQITPVDPHAAQKLFRIDFSDGSAVSLQGQSRAEVRDLDANGGHIAMVIGRARVTLANRPRARWQITVGPYVIEAGGGIFDLDWSEDAQALEVWSTAGSVRASGPLIGSGMQLGPGQHLSTRIRDNKIALDRRSAPR